MNKILLLADIHFGRNNFSKNVFLKDLEYFEEIVFPYIISNRITEVIVAGDLVDNRNLSDNFILQESKSRFFKWFDNRGVNLHILIGNHDTRYKNRIDYNFPSTNLKEFQHTTVYDTQRIVNICGYRIGFIPWIPSLSDTSIIPHDKIDLIVGHFDIKDALMQGNVKSPKGMDIENFKKYKQVLSGHYHATSDYNNVKYIGSPFQMNYRDYRNKKGFWVLNDNYSFEYIENEFSPKYLKLFYKECDDGDIELSIGGLLENTVDVTIDEAIELMKCNYFKFIVTKLNNQSLLQDVFTRITVNAYDRVDIINDTNNIEETQEILQEDLDEDLDLIDIIKKYVDSSTFNGNNINKTVLSRKLSEIYKITKEGSIE